MDQTALPNETQAASEDVQTTTSMLRTKFDIHNARSVERSLSRAAVRELEARERNRYAAEDAEDEAILAAMRKEMDDAAEAMRVEAWNMAVARELASAERRTAWVDAHSNTVDIKRAVRDAQRQALEEYRRMEEERRAQMRIEREHEEEALRASTQAAATAKALEEACRHEAWNEARAVTAEAKRAARAALKAARDARKASRAETHAAQEHARHERNEIAEARAAAIRKAVQDSAVATVIRRDLEREGAPFKEIEAARAYEQAMRAAEAEIKARARHERNEAEEALRVERNKEATERAMAEVELRNPWLEARYAQALEYRKMKASDKAARNLGRAEEVAAEAAARHARNAQAEARRLESAKLNTDRELMVAAMQEEYLDALEVERKIWASTVEVDKPARAADLARERTIAEQRRHERNAAEDAYQAAAWNLRKERGYARAMEREAARETAQEAYEKMKAAMAEEA